MTPLADVVQPNAFSNADGEQLRERGAQAGKRKRERTGKGTVLDSCISRLRLLYIHMVANRSAPDVAFDSGSPCSRKQRIEQCNYRGPSRFSENRSMTAPAFQLATSGIIALLAFALSFVTDGRVARRLAVASLWLALATVPCSIVWDVAVAPPPELVASSKATRLGAAISHVMNYGAVVVPFAGLAMIAMRRATVAGSKRQRR